MSEKDQKSQDKIPASKVERAAKFVQTGIKVGGNYIRHYAKKAIDPETSREELHAANAADIYDSLSELKGSALKVAQMMSMDKNLLPKAYIQRFQMAQYAAPPLSYPLVVRTFERAFGKNPTQLFDSFTKDAVNAASIGQVHQATLQGQKLAVKVQYPGVADSIHSDLRLVRPFAVSLLGLNEKDVDFYMEEVANMLISETDYTLELRRGTDIPKACAHIGGLRFPRYYPEYSSDRILTMEWIDGLHVEAFMATHPPQEVRNRIGQALWDFYDYQIHRLREVHADPHPGNFIIGADGSLGVIDFGCVKVIPEDYYQQYFILLDSQVFSGEYDLNRIFEDLQFLYPEDEPDERAKLSEIFSHMIGLLGKPFYNGHFDFGDDAYFEEITAFGEEMSKRKELRESKRPRGSRHALYINRTYFGLYTLLNQLKANIKTHTSWQRPR